MNYYEKHLGDYARDTGHLTQSEHGAYNLLLDRYYATEGPIPDDIVYSVSRAATAAERAVTDRILKQFFKRDGNSWRHKRCDELIGDLRFKFDEVAERKAHERERKHRLRERRKELFAELRKFGKFPEFDAPVYVLEELLSKAKDADKTVSVPPLSPDCPRDIPVSVPPSGTAIHTPSTKHQSPEEEDRPRKRGSRLPQPLPLTPEWAAAAAAVGKEEGRFLQPDFITREFRKFCDHWWGKAGKDGSKLDWLATWRNWVRRSCEWAPKAESADDGRLTLSASEMAS